MKRILKSLKKVLLSGLVLLVIPHTYAAEDNIYDFLWLDPDKKVYVLQNKSYRKKNSLFVELAGSKTVNSPFIKSWGGALKLGYYFSEQFGLDVFYHTYTASTTTNYDGVLSLNEGEPFVRYAKNLIGATFLWTPFYGKVNTFNKIFYFDWGFGLGAGQIKTESNLRTAGIPNQTQKKFVEEEGYIGVIYKTDFRFHINKNFHVSIEFRNIHFSAPDPSEALDAQGFRTESDKKINTNSNLIFGLGYKF